MRHSTSLLKQKIQFEVEFIETLHINTAIEIIKQYTNPQVLMWYIGPRGLRETGTKFYRQNIIFPLIHYSNAKLWLVDLTAWGAFSNKNCSTKATSSCCEKLNDLLKDRIKCIPSSLILNQISEISDPKLIQYFHSALKKSFISEASRNFPDKNILTKEIFSSEPPIISDWLYEDVSKSYSAIQYLEGCFLVNELFRHHGLSQNLHIVFILPNDELKYYKDNENSFRHDISFLITQKSTETNTTNINLKVSFISFSYGNRIDERPYNAPGKALKQNDIHFDNIIGSAQQSTSIPKNQTEVN